MRGLPAALLGVIAFLIAGFLHGTLRDSSDPELVLAGVYALSALWLFGVLAGGVAVGIRLSRD